MSLRLISAITLACLITAGPALAAAATTPAATTPAATTTTAKPAATMAAKPMKGHFYVAQAADTKACSVVTAKPDGKTSMMIGKFWYSTSAKATAAMKHDTACKSA